MVERALSRDPSSRFGDADEMRHALEQAMVAIGQPTTTDDVAAALGHFSKERTQRRREAIDAVLRAAAVLRQSGERANANDPSRLEATVALGGDSARGSAPGSLAGSHPGSNPGSHSGAGSHPGSHSGSQPHAPMALGSTRVLSKNDLGISGENPSAASNSGITGPSMRTMQGAVLSRPPPPLPPEPASGFGKMIAAGVVVGVVVVLGIVGFVVVGQNSAPAGGGSSVNAPAMPAVPSAEPTATVPAAPFEGTAAGVILGASDAGPVVAPQPTPAPTPTPTPTVHATATGGGKAAGGGKKSGTSKGRGPGDEYGF